MKLNKLKNLTDILHHHVSLRKLVTLIKSFNTPNNRIRVFSNLFLEE